MDRQDPVEEAWLTHHAERALLISPAGGATAPLQVPDFTQTWSFLPHSQSLLVSPWSCRGTLRLSLGKRDFPLCTVCRMFVFLISPALISLVYPCLSSQLWPLQRCKGLGSEWQMEGKHQPRTPQWRGEAGGTAQWQSKCMEDVIGAKQNLS